jgi:hypothetical protein
MPLKHSSFDYDGGAPDIPFGVGDKYYSQDLFRDLQFLEDLTGRSVTDFLGAMPVILKGGLVDNDVTVDTIKISAGVGYHEIAVKVPNSYASLPPSVTTAQKIVRVVWSAQANLAIPSAVLDGVTVNYVKVAYAETSSPTRARALKAGTWVYEKTPSFVITVNPTAPTSGEILLATFTGLTTLQFIYTQKYPTINQSEEAQSLAFFYQG